MAYPLFNYVELRVYKINKFRNRIQNKFDEQCIETLKRIERLEKMKYQIQENCLTIFLPREVDHFHVADMRSQVDTIIEANHIKHVIFDFKNTKFMDSSGIGAIMGRYKLIYLLGGEVWGVNANSHIKKLLLMSGMDQIMRIYEEDVENEYC